MGDSELSTAPEGRGALRQAPFLSGTCDFPRRNTDALHFGSCSLVCSSTLSFSWTLGYECVRAANLKASCICCFFPCFLFKAKQARAFLTVGFGFALSNPQHVKWGADAVGTRVAEPLKPGSGTADLARDSRELSHLCRL